VWFREVTAAYSENQNKAVNTRRDQNAELLYVKEGGMYSYHCVLNGYKF
jgi:hypothetical protein